MSRRGALTIRIAAFVVALAVLSGCAYDYLQHSDRVAYSAGDAVKANIEGETTDPANDDSYKTGGLGKDGDVTPSAAQ